MWKSMPALSSISDSDLIARMPALVHAERAAIAEVIEHLMEIDQRRLYLGQACSSLYAYCMRLGYSEEGALKRVRVTRLAEQVPRVLDELRSGAVHLTALYVLSKHLTEDNAEALLGETRGRSRRALELVLARWFPRPMVKQQISPQLDPPSCAASAAASHPEINPSGPPLSSALLGKGESRAPFKLEPLSISSYRIQFTASAELYAKIEKARALLSHALRANDLAELFERALEELLARETKRRLGAGRPRQQRKLKPGSRHVPVEVARTVWERDGNQCSFVDAEGRRCNERRFLTLEHRQPFALGGHATADNLCVLCSAHNAYTARQVFGERHIAKQRRQAKKRAERVKSDDPKSTERARTDTFAKALSALEKLGFHGRQVTPVLAELREARVAPGLEPLVRAALTHLVPAPA
jgi:hypothetical protein